MAGLVRGYVALEEANLGGDDFRKAFNQKLKAEGIELRIANLFSTLLVGPIKTGINTEDYFREILDAAESRTACGDAFFAAHCAIKAIYSIFDTISERQRRKEIKALPAPPGFVKALAEVEQIINASYPTQT